MFNTLKLQDIGYRKECNEFTETKCRTVFDTKSEEKCTTSYKKQCDMVYETVTDWEYEQKCSTSYEQQCHGYGYHQECEKVRLVIICISQTRFHALTGAQRKM